MRIAIWSGAAAVALLLGACGGGAGSGTAPVPAPQANRPPSAAVGLQSGVRVNATTGAIAATVGAVVELSTTGSADPDGDTLSFTWSLVTRPAGSAAAMSAATGVMSTFTPDVLGDYTVSLIVSDGKGGQAERRVSITADNQAPNATVVINVQYAPTPTVMPTQNVIVGSTIVLNGGNSTDPNGDALTHAWLLLEQPAGSSAALDTAAGPVARFVLDRLGSFRVRSRVTDARGAYQETIYVFVGNNQAPNPVIASTITPATGGGTTLLNASVGYEVLLNAGGTTDADGDSISFSWSITARPTGSTAALSATGGASTLLAPDLLGTYTIVLRATDNRGAYVDHTVTLQVNNRRPTIVLAPNASPIPVASVAPIRVPVGNEVILHGGDSRDADGDALTFDWSVTSRPAGSVASLTVSTPPSQARFTPDVRGSYVVKLRVTDTKGAFAEQSLVIDVGNFAPRLVLDKERAVVVVGTGVQVNAGLSFDEDGDTLTYAWTFDSKPAGSALALAATSSAISLTPDVPGTYVARVSVSDGLQTATGYFTVVAKANALGTVNLTFAPEHWAYSRGLDLVVLTTASPPSVRIVEPATATVRTVLLPVAPKALAVSANGRRAAVAHNGAVSYINLETSTLLRTVATNGDHTEVFLRDDGIAYLIGQTGGQWVNPGVIGFNLNTGAQLIGSAVGGGGFFYGTQRGVFADRKNKALFVAEGLSPSDISFFTVDPVTGTWLTTGDSIYHGDFAIQGPLWLSADQEIVFTASGTYFRTASLLYAGTLPNAALLRSLSHSSALSEVIALRGTFDYMTFTTLLHGSYKRYTGAFFSPEPDLALPMVGGALSYGVAIFHANNGNHVFVVQTGTQTLGGIGASYHVVYR